MPLTDINGRPVRTQPLWARVDKNRVKLAVFVVAFIGGSAVLLTLALVAVPGYMLGWGAGQIGLYASADWYARMPWVLLASLGALLLVGGLIAAVQLANAADWVRNRFDGTWLIDGDHPGLASAIEDMSIAAGLSAPPEIMVLDRKSVNAFAIGTTRKSPVIGVTQGLLSKLTLDEQRAVAAVLIARIAAGDILFGTALAALMGPIKAIRGSGTAAAGCAGMAGDGCGSGCNGPGCVSADLDGCSDGCSGCGSVGDLFSDSDSAGGCLAAIVVVVFLAIVAAVTYAAVVSAAWIVTVWGRALHRTSYEKADAEGMLLLKDPAPMLSALKKAILSSTRIADGDPSYDGIFYTSTSGTRAIEKVERRRFGRLCEVLGVEGAAATLDDAGAAAWVASEEAEAAADAEVAAAAAAADPKAEEEPPP